MRVVLDNNVLISAALLKNSIPYKAFCKAVDKHNILRSYSLVAELRNTIYKNKFDRYFLNKSSRDAFVLSFITASINIDIKNKIIACRDPKDNMYLELAVSGKANIIITGDTDLLVLNPFHNTTILTPREFLDQF